ncbi:MAG: DUF427 domain-containing protein [Rhodobacter sp.]|nr:DUF427 domain-containing protein [Rhodobacter sp.]
MADHIKIRRASGTWVVRAAGAVLGESKKAIELSESGHDPVIYFPRSDIAMAFLERSEKTSHCPHKGDASYYSIAAKSGLIHDAAWSYETPKDHVADIAGHLAFHTDRVTVEEL